MHKKCLLHVNMDILVSYYNNKSYIDLLKCFKNLSDSSITYSIYNNVGK